MKQFILMIAAAVCLLPVPVPAKRVGPAQVTPVIHDGIRYTAPNDDGRRAYIEAWEVQSDKKLWTVMVFTNRINPELEADVQWVFIKSLMIQNDALVVTAENGKIYQVDLKSKQVTPSARPDKLRQPARAGSYDFALRFTQVTFTFCAIESPGAYSPRPRGFLAKANSPTILPWIRCS